MYVHLSEQILEFIHDRNAGLEESTGGSTHGHQAVLCNLDTIVKWFEFYVRGIFSPRANCRSKSLRQRWPDEVERDAGKYSLCVRCEHAVDVWHTLEVRIAAAKVLKSGRRLRM
jgi:hypothetical protein